MSASDATTARPGLQVGPTSEFSLFFDVKPGQGESLRKALSEVQNAPGYRPGDYKVAIATIHEAGFVLFDDDTRLAFMTSFDGPWDPYMDDFFNSGPTLALFDAIFKYVEGVRGASRPGGGQGVRSWRSGDGWRLPAQLPRHGEGDRQGAARQRGLPAGARRPGRGGGAAASGAEAVARGGCRLGNSAAREGPCGGSHISELRALAEPNAAESEYAAPGAIIGVYGYRPRQQSFRNAGPCEHRVVLPQRLGGSERRHPQPNC